jgi:RimJ/RimL family protein N-acetyltransferase
VLGVDEVGQLLALRQAELRVGVEQVMERGCAGLGGADDEEIDRGRVSWRGRVTTTDPTLQGLPDLRLRPVAEADAERLLAWRNDPESRAASRNTAEIGADEHALWLAGVLVDPDRRLLIAELGGEPVGQVRFDPVAEDRYEIAIALAPRARGRGLAAPLISLALAWLRESFPGAGAVAHVREGNAPSLAAFRRAGFVASGEPGEDGFVVLLSGGGSASA